MTEQRFVTYDDILKEIGEFGPFQVRSLLVLFLVSCQAGLSVVTYVFTGYEPSYRCAVPSCEHSDSEYRNDSLYFALVESGLEPQDCRHIEPLDESCTNFTFHDKKCSSRIIFDRSVMTSTIIEEYGLICDRRKEVQIYQSLYMIGMFIGSYIFGILSDTIGRKRALVYSTFTAGIFGSFSTACLGDKSEIYFGILRVLTGSIGGAGMFTVSLILAMELMGEKFVNVIGVMIQLPFAIGMLIFDMEAFFIRDWEILQIISHAPIFVLALLIRPKRHLSESIRWLMSKRNKHVDAIISIRLAGEINGRDDFGGSFLDLTFCNRDSTPGPQALVHDSGDEENSWCDRTLILRLFNMSFQWFAVTFVYYGLLFNSTQMVLDNEFTNFALCVCSELIGYIFSMIMMNPWGRRPILTLCQAIAGIACIFWGLTLKHDDLKDGRMILFLVGKFGASAAFAILFIYTTELFPTVHRRVPKEIVAPTFCAIRGISFVLSLIFGTWLSHDGSSLVKKSEKSRAVGFCYSFGRTAGICVIYLKLIQPVWTALPMVILGSLGVLTGFLALRLPETANRGLPNTVEQARRIGEESSVRDIFAFRLFRRPTSTQKTEDFANDNP